MLECLIITSIFNNIFIFTHMTADVHITVQQTSQLSTLSISKSSQLSRTTYSAVLTTEQSTVNRESEKKPTSQPLQATEYRQTTRTTNKSTNQQLQATGDRATIRQATYDSTKLPLQTTNVRKSGRQATRKSTSKPPLIQLYTGQKSVNVCVY